MQGTLRSIPGLNQFVWDRNDGEHPESVLVNFASDWDELPDVNAVGNWSVVLGFEANFTRYSNLSLADAMHRAAQDARRKGWNQVAFAPPTTESQDIRGCFVRDW